MTDFFNELSNLSYRSKAFLAAGAFFAVTTAIFITGAVNYLLFEQAEMSRQFLLNEIKQITISETDRMIKTCNENK